MNRRIWLAPAALLAGVFVFMTLAAALYLPPHLKQLFLTTIDQSHERCATLGKELERYLPIL